MKIQRLAEINTWTARVGKNEDAEVVPSVGAEADITEWKVKVSFFLKIWIN
jgi:hypothetical protein